MAKKHQPSTPAIPAKGKSEIVRFEMAKFTPADSGEKESMSSDWVPYGEANLFPQYLIRQALSSPVHGPMVMSIAQMIAGNGFTGDIPISKSDFQNLCLDLKIQGGFFLHCFPTADGKKIGSIKHLPFERCRMMKEVGDDIPGIWYSKDWENRSQPKNNPIPITTARTDGDAPKSFVVWGFRQTPGVMYYPKPDYISGMNWAEITAEISEFQINNLLNGFFPGSFVTMIDGAKTLEEKTAQKQKLQAATGTSGAGKMIIFSAENKDSAPIIEQAVVNNADKQYQFLSEEAQKQIFIMHRVTTPLLFGIRASGGLGSNKDELTEGLRIFTKYVIQPFRQLVIDTFQSVGFEIGFMDDEAEIETETLSIDSHKIEMSESDESIWLAHLEKSGEKVSLDEWEVVEESFCDSLNEPVETKLKLAAQQKSEFGDAGLYKLRYRYSTNLSPESRNFCKRMVDLSVAGILYRKEDIDVMSDSGVNGQFAPSGQTTYDIFNWKGGVYCHHKWVRVIFLRKRDKNGKILPASKTDEMENDKIVGNNPYVPKKGDEGVRPIDTANRGSLKH